MGNVCIGKPILYGLGLVGFLGTWGRSMADGTLMRLFQALHSSDPYVLPNTSQPLLGRFTGITYPVDYLLRVLVVFFWEAVDGSHPAASVTGIYFLGQLLPCIVIIYLKALRGQSPSLMKPTSWLLLFQGCTIGCTGSIWAASHLTRLYSSNVGESRDAFFRESIIVSPNRTRLLVPAVLLGYLFPAVLMGLRSTGAHPIVSNTFQQFAIAIWNVYPLLVLGFLCMAGIKTNQKTVRSRITILSIDEHLRTIRTVSGIIILISSVIHIAVTAISLSSLLFPTIFKPALLPELSPTVLALPPITLHTGMTVGDGIHSFFLWDQITGYASVMAVVYVELQNAYCATRQPFPWLTIVTWTTVTSLILGPGTTCMIGTWLQEEIIFNHWKKHSATEESRKH